MSNDPKEELEEEKLKILAAYHKTILEAMRSREEAILKFLALFGLPMTGYIWLLLHYNNHTIPASCCPIMCDTIIVSLWGIVGAALGTIVLLVFGAGYVLTLSYNFRYLEFVLTRAEMKLGAYASESSSVFKDIMPEKWKFTQESVKKWRCWNFDLAPEMFKVMLWLSVFLTFCVFLTLFYILFSQCSGWQICLVALQSIFAALVATAIVFLFLRCGENHYRKKISEILPEK